MLWMKSLLLKPKKSFNVVHSRWFLGGDLSDEVGRLEFVDLIKKWLLIQIGVSFKDCTAYGLCYSVTIMRIEQVIPRCKGYFLY